MMPIDRVSKGQAEGALIKSSLSTSMVLLLGTIEKAV